MCAIYHKQDASIGWIPLYIAIVYSNKIILGFGPNKPYLLWEF